MNRAFEMVELELKGRTYEVTVKIASDADGKIHDESAEYEDAKAVARETDLSIWDVIRRMEKLDGTTQ